MFENFLKNQDESAMMTVIIAYFSQEKLYSFHLQKSRHELFRGRLLLGSLPTGTEYLGPNGFEAVQVAPVTEHILGYQWWVPGLKRDPRHPL